MLVLKKLREVGNLIILLDGGSLLLKALQLVDDVPVDLWVVI